MSIVIAALALLAPAAPPQTVTASTAAAAETDASRAARVWLALVDASDWAGSFAGTGSAFRSANSLDGWRSASEKARVPLGRVVSRTLVDDHDVPATPNGARNVRFRTEYGNRAGAMENLVLVREDGAWKVAGIYIE